VALGSAQSVTQKRTRGISWGGRDKDDRCVGPAILQT